MYGYLRGRIVSLGGDGNAPERLPRRIGSHRACGRWFQLDASAKYYDANDLGNNDSGYQVEGQSDLSERFALSVAYEDIQEYEQVSAGIRLYFHSPFTGATCTPVPWRGKRPPGGGRSWPVAARWPVVSAITSDCGREP